jgi:hypothetical protein
VLFRSHPAINVFVAEACKLSKMRSARKRFTSGATARQSMVLFPDGFEMEISSNELGDHIENFSESIRRWKRENMGDMP